jgi:hypothetical protein
MKKWCAFSLLLVLNLTSAAYALPAEVILIRHAEKPAQGNELSPRGWQRAFALVGFFLNNPMMTRFGTPTVLFPMAQMSVGGSVRAIQTITPLAKQLGLPLHLNYTRDQYPEAAQEILRNPAYDGKTVLICWEHKVLPDFAAHLGLRNGPTDWPDSVFDRAWVIDYSGDRIVGFHDLPQRLLAGDSAR